jgi:hypothetical protein
MAAEQKKEDGWAIDESTRVCYYLLPAGGFGRRD